MDEGTSQWKGWMVGGVQEEGRARIISFLIGHWATKQEENKTSWILTSILPTVCTPKCARQDDIQIQIDARARNVWWFEITTGEMTICLSVIKINSCKLKIIQLQNRLEFSLWRYLWKKVKKTTFSNIFRLLVGIREIERSSLIKKKNTNRKRRKISISKFSYRVRNTVH